MDDSNLRSKMIEEQTKRLIKKPIIRNFIDEIIPNLYLGDLNGALTNKDNFDVIINLSQFDYSTKAQIYNIKIDDHPSINIIEYINQYKPIIDNGLKNNKKILVHCLMGKSRSASIILGYLMITNNISYDEATKLINEKIISLISSQRLLN